MTTKHTFKLLHDTTDISIAKLSSPIQFPVPASHLYSQTVTNDEISVVAPSTFIAMHIEYVKEQSGPWQTIKIDQQLDFDMIGVLSQLSLILAKKDISVFVISTYNTDYLLVRNEQIDEALTLLNSQGHRVTSVESFD